MSAELLTKLIEAGTPPHLVAEVAMELAAAAAVKAKAEKKRAYDREYQNERRASRTTSYDSNDVVERVSLDKEKSPRPPKEINPFPSENAREAVFHRLPDGWQPTKPLPPQVQAKVDQWPPGKREDVTACFKRWAANAPDQNGKGRKKDWDKAFWNWITREHDERFANRPTPIGKSQAAYRLAMQGVDPDEPF